MEEVDSGDDGRSCCGCDLLCVWKSDIVSFT